MVVGVGRSMVGFCSGFWWAVTVGWVLVGLAMSFGDGCGSGYERWWLVAVGWVGFCSGF